MVYDRNDYFTLNYNNSARWVSDDNIVIKKRIRVSFAKTECAHIRLLCYGNTRLEKSYRKTVWTTNNEFQTVTRTSVLSRLVEMTDRNGKFRKSTTTRAASAVYNNVFDGIDWCYFYLCYFKLIVLFDFQYSVYRVSRVKSRFQTNGFFFYLLCFFFSRSRQYYTFFQP